MTDINARSTISFYNGSHSKLFTHLLGESSSIVSGQYGTMDKWVLKPGQPNHWWDCLVMSSVAASACKIPIPNFGATAPSSPSVGMLSSEPHRPPDPLPVKVLWI